MDDSALEVLRELGTEGTFDHLFVNLQTVTLHRCSAHR
jgi:hypothetical protein